MTQDPAALVGTPAAAATLGISARTLQRYAFASTLTPHLTLPSGQYRWDLAELAQQTAAWRGTPGRAE